MGVLPHMDSLWFGENFDYERETADYWLLEVSGLPFGLAGSVMCGLPQGAEAAAWRGMLYAATGRECTYGSDGAPPPGPRASALWPFLSEVGIERARMAGYWDGASPLTVRNCSSDVRATVYARAGEVTFGGRTGGARAGRMPRLPWCGVAELLTPRVRSPRMAARSRGPCQLGAVKPRRPPSHGMLSGGGLDGAPARPLPYCRLCPVRTQLAIVPALLSERAADESARECWARWAGVSGARARGARPSRGSECRRRAAGVAPAAPTAFECDSTADGRLTSVCSVWDYYSRS